LTDVNAFDAGAEGDIDSVVDEQWDVGRLCDFVQGFCILDELCGVTLLVTVLYDRCAWAGQRL